MIPSLSSSSSSSYKINTIFCRRRLNTPRAKIINCKRRRQTNQIMAQDILYSGRMRYFILHFRLQMFARCFMHVRSCYQLPFGHWPEAQVLTVLHHAIRRVTCEKQQQKENLWHVWPIVLNNPSLFWPQIKKSAIFSPIRKRHQLYSAA